MRPLRRAGPRPGAAGRLPRHELGPGILRVATPPPGSGGLVLGLRAAHPVAVRIFRPEPTRVVAAGLDSARLVAVRALAVGAEVRVGTSRPSAWAPLGRLSADGAHRVLVVHGPVRAGSTASVDAPLLVIRDEAPEGRPGNASPGRGDHPAPSPSARPAAGTTPGAWTARLTVVRAPAAPAYRAVLTSADVVLLDRLEADEAATVAAVLGAPPGTARRLDALRPDEVLVVTRGAEPVVVDLRPGAAERRLLGLPAPRGVQPPSPRAQA